MSNIVTITNAKKNILEFSLEIKGISDAKMSVKFIIEVDNMQLSFDAVAKKKNNWEVTIPALAILEKTMYKFHVDAVVDGYFFEAMKGSVNVVGSHEIFSTKPKNVTYSPKIEKKDDSSKTVTTKKTEEKKENVKKTEKVVVKKDSKPEIKVEKKKDVKEGEKDSIVQKIVNDIIKTKPSFNKKLVENDKPKVDNVRKITKDKKIVEIDSKKEEKVKEILESVVQPKDEKVKEILATVEMVDESVEKVSLFKKKDIIVH